MRSVCGFAILLLAVISLGNAGRALAEAAVHDDNAATGHPNPEDVERAIKETQSSWDSGLKSFNITPYVANPIGLVCADRENKYAMAATMIVLPGQLPSIFAIIPHPLSTNPFQMKKINDSLDQFNANRNLDRDWLKFVRLKYQKEYAAQRLVRAEILARAVAKRDRPLKEIEETIESATKDQAINSLAQPGIVDSSAMSVRSTMRETEPAAAQKELTAARDHYQKVLKPYLEQLENPKIKEFKAEEKRLTDLFDGDKDKAYSETIEKAQDGFRITRYTPKLSFFGMVPAVYGNSDGSQWMSFNVGEKDRTQVAGPDRILMKTSYKTTNVEGEDRTSVQHPFQWEHYVDTPQGQVKRTFLCM
jgi:hypothetical protein